MEEGGGGKGGEVAEEASPISSRPPLDFEELTRLSTAGDDGGGSSSSSNRWPREETLSLLRIRSDMDSAFRHATLKAPLWEDVSRKLSEIGYKRSAKKCREKFENVHKYYKRTKDSRGGRHDGKAYKFFTQLEALNTPDATLDVAPLSVANPLQTPFSTATAGMPSSNSPFTVFPPPPHPYTSSFTATPITPTPPPVAAPAVAGVTFSSHSSSTASGMGSDYDDDMDVDAAKVAGPSKRKRGNNKMMELLEGLVRKVLQKQDAMQRSFLEALEKREQERIDHEEAWKRQEMSRLAREHELMAQERAASASRDMAVASLVQTITGHTIQFSPSHTQPPPQAPRQSPWQEIQHIHHHHHSQVAQKPNIQSQLQPVMAITPSQQREKQHDQMGIGSARSSEPATSRWPKAEVLALINLRSGLEPRFQEAGPKGPLWEEISAEMQRIGYSRSAKRCKEKWENINKYYKKVKESNKNRPEDSKTCPYFHCLDSLHRTKVLGCSSSSGEQFQRTDQDQTLTPKESDRNDEHTEESPQEGALMEGGAEKARYEQNESHLKLKPEDRVRELMQQKQANAEQEQQKLMAGEYEKIEELQLYNLEEDEDEDQGEEDEKTAYQIAFQSSSNRGNNGSFLTMVQ